MNRRTSFFTAAAVTGIVLAGTTAVAANIGVLNRAAGTGVGDLSVSDVAPSPSGATSQIVDVYIEDPALTVGTSTTSLPPTVAPDGTTQSYAVADAGTATVSATPTGIVLDGVTVTHGWAWVAVQPSPRSVEITFTSGDTSYVFYADQGVDGSISARVDQPILNVVQVAAPSVPTAAPSGQSNTVGDEAYNEYGDHDGREDEASDDGHDDDEHDGERYDDEEYEGGDDDD